MPNSRENSVEGQGANGSLRHGARAGKTHFHARRLPGVARHGELIGYPQDEKEPQRKKLGPLFGCHDGPLLLCYSYEYRRHCHSPNPQISRNRNIYCPLNYGQYSRQTADRQDHQLLVI